MKIKYNRSGISRIGREIGAQSEELAEIQNSILNILSRIPNHWKGIDAEVFVANYTSFIRGLNTYRGMMQDFSSFYNRNSKRLRGNDTDYVDKVNKVGDKYVA